MKSRKKVLTVPFTSLRANLHNLIFEAETKAGKIFDIIRMILIAFSVATVMMDSIAVVRSEYGELLHYLE
jgi:voltage-gated potassium channel